MPGSATVPAGRWVVQVTFAVFGLTIAWWPGAAASPSYNDVRAIGGTTVWFTALAVTSLAQAVTWWLGQLWWHAATLVAEAAVLLLLAAMVGAEAVTLHGQGAGGAELFAGFALLHVVYVPAAMRDAAT